ncbi:pentatricopeptide repeat-containing protein At3g09040, mitochondrial [Rhododendron vialii]|uniref:pentatricopeptide repeat-containing protein At3g09040, mitochondrial n=1 Tax=Rhododendron vialii TaxID=182163 RepID=UPI00265D9B20|nr:pentatricopeptide repeat-containing protein At3g09040, mitochondrial [Rhododendron vialii]XP_058186152.1 pentatricopeptide repeat-containing protein At3g09040, mitochondrial [Rhododendron vialii]XP_058186153.1 pentatricopeptide repeat-containing protein At3g09040, mitochondrial [Rhododendron vialii]XP_058186154.1 pentatricopeptide repeat-containing protein At3g09040, mitochondrial [Rhododendron vialii]XP_058186155.1 pentatricopeptide repeat-containing protein At3g09040, mitochondrial [Rhodod
MAKRAYSRLLHKPNSCTVPQETRHAHLCSELYSTSEYHIHTHLLNTCIHQCKQIQSRRLFDEMPERLSLASKTSKVVHSQSLKLGIGSQGRLGNAIVDLYAKCGNIEFAEKAFHRLESVDLCAWNSILSLYSRQGLLDQALWHFGSMRNCGVGPNQYTFAVLLSVCGRLMDAEFGKQVHCNVIKTGFEFNSFCEGSLIDLYAKLNYVIDARRIFDAAEEPDTVSWTAIIFGYVQAGLPEEAVKLFEDMQKLSCFPDQVAFVTVISAFLELGRLDDACQLFARMPNPNAVAWNVMISGHAKRGYEWEAVKLFQNMRIACVRSTRSTLGSVLSAIAGMVNLEYGLQVHAQATKQGFDSNVYVGSSLINMYAKCQKMEDAKRVFGPFDEKNVVLWNAMLGGYLQNGYAGEVMELFFSMRVSGFHPDEFTYTSILSACGCLENLGMGQQLHSYIIKNKLEDNLFVGNALVDMYAKSGALDYARRKFELLKNRDNVSWNAIIVGYVQDEKEDEAFKLFERMTSDGITPDEVSLASILSACANLRALDRGKQVHCLSVRYGLETSLYAGSSLIDMYAKCGAIATAYEVFISMPERSVISANALIAGYAQHNLEKAVYLLHDMLAEGLKPSEITFAYLLDACTGPSTLNLGRLIHCFILKAGLAYEDDFLSISLLGMYMCSQGKIDANILFSELPNPKSAVLWTAIISGHAQNDCSEEALQFYLEMRRQNAMPDQATFASVLRACSLLASLRDGREVHSLIFHTGFDLDELTSSALIDMYAKCGDVQSSIQIFTEMDTKNDVISWNSMIVAFGKNGYAEDALRTFDKMKEAHVKPDDVTFLGVLTACSHAGRVFEGRQVYDIMINHYHIEPRPEHCACMIDLLGRWGFIDEAQEFIHELEFEPDAMMWATFLAACRLHGDDIRGQHAAEKLIELEPEKSSPYVLLSHIHAALGNWDGVNSVRRRMKEKGVRKFPGCSWIVVGEKTNLFIAGDKSHPSVDEIHKVLKDLTELMKDEDYFTKIECFVCNIED